MAPPDPSPMGKGYCRKDQEKMVSSDTRADACQAANLGRTVVMIYPTELWLLTEYFQTNTRERLTF